MATNLLLLLAAFALVALNGFFVAAEFGMVKLRHTRVEAIARERGLPGRILARVHGELDVYLSACQLGITLASLGLGWIGEPAFASLLSPLLYAIGIDSPEAVHGIALVTAFSIISYLHIVVGELVPKSLAIRITEPVALWTALPLFAFYWLMYPGIWLLNHSSNWVLRLAGIANTSGHDTHYSPEELKLILRSSRGADQFTRDEWNVLAQALDFAELTVADLMRPIREAAVLTAADTLEENLEVITQRRFSRYPYFDAQGRAEGMIHLKDLFLAQQQGRRVEDLGEYLRPIQQVSPELPALELLRRFRTGAPHFAVVGDKDGPPLGFLTLDNLLGALVGEIRDEFRQGGNDWLRMDDGSFLGKGSLPIFTLERTLGMDIEREEANTIAGLVMERLGSVPHEGQRIVFEGFDVVIKRMKGPRVLLVRVYPLG